MTHQAVIYLRASDFAGARQSKPRPVKGANDTARQGRLLALLSHFASMSSVTGSAQALGISESAVRFDLCLANNLSETQLVRLGGLQDGDAVELTDAAYELLPERLAGLFARYLDAPAAWQGPFRGFHRRRAMLNRLATRIAVRNRLFGRVGALRLKVGRVDVEVDLGAGLTLIAAVELAEFNDMGLRAGTELCCLVAPDDVLLAIDPLSTAVAGNVLRATVSAHQDFAADGVVLDLAGGKTLLAQIGDDQASALQLHAELPVWAVISPGSVTLALDTVGQVRPQGSQTGSGRHGKQSLIPFIQGAAMESGTLTYDSLMAHARDPDNPVTRALAGAIASAAAGYIEAPNLALGLSWARYTALLAQHFPGAESQTCVCGETCREGCRPLRGDEFQDLVELLLSHRSHEDDATEWLAYAIASACMGGNHLYQDMGLPNRQALSELLKEHFTLLFEKNSGNMKWKKFFYKQLCDQVQVRVCQAPSCQVCNDYFNCFGPEDDSFPASLTASAGPLGTAA